MYLLQMAKICDGNGLNDRQAEVFIRAMLMIRPGEFDTGYMNQLARRFKDEFCLGDGFKFNGENRATMATDRMFPSRFDHIHLVAIAKAFNQVIGYIQPEQPLIPLPEKVIDHYWSSEDNVRMEYERQYNYETFEKGENCEEWC